MPKATDSTSDIRVVASQASTVGHDVGRACASAGATRPDLAEGAAPALSEKPGSVSFDG